ncbi:MAG: hypothetical protein ABSH15_06690 [Verrucomicrobiota bacterium]|jgi:predicted helicase
MRTKIEICGNAVAGKKLADPHVNYESAQKFSLIYDLYALTPAEIKIEERRF